MGVRVKVWVRVWAKVWFRVSVRVRMGFRVGIMAQGWRVPVRCRDPVLLTGMVRRMQPWHGGLLCSRGYGYACPWHGGPGNQGIGYRARVIRV